MLGDVVAYVPSDVISGAEGFFRQVSGVASEKGPIGNVGPDVNDAYALQLNTNQFAFPGKCFGSPTGCTVWQQFVFDNAGARARVYIQYWLIRFNAKSCPSSDWNLFNFDQSTDVYCWMDSPAAPVIAQPIGNLADLALVGKVTNVASAEADTVTLDTTGKLYTVTWRDFGAALGWNSVEFNVFGDGGNPKGGGQAKFTPVGDGDVDLQPDIEFSSGKKSTPVCESGTFTDETNNLKFAPLAPSPDLYRPALVSHENLIGGANPPCSAAVPS
jgi:hypothetical protein